MFEKPYRFLFSFACIFEEQGSKSGEKKEENESYEEPSE